MSEKPVDPVFDSPKRNAKGQLLPGSRLNPHGRTGDPAKRAEVMKDLYRNGPEVIEMLMQWAREGDKKIALFLADKLFPDPAPMEVHEEPATTEGQGRTWTVAELRARREGVQ